MKNKFFIIYIILLTIIYSYELLKFSFSPLLLNYGSADILINYEYGFIRRGFLGTIFISLHKIGINPLLAIRIFVLINYSIVCFLFISNFHKLKLDYKLLLFPFFLPYLLLCNMLEFRDLFLIILLYVILYNFNCKIKLYNKLIIILLSIIGVLVHEMFFLYYVSSLFIYLFIKYGVSRFYNLLYFLPSLITFLFILIYQKNYNGLALNFFNSIKSKLPINSIVNNEIPNSILAIEGKLSNHINYVFQLNNLGFSRGFIYLTFVAFIFCLLFNIHLFLRKEITKYDFNKLKLLPFIFLGSILMTLPLYYAAIDWQRFINMSFLISFILYFNITKLEINTKAIILYKLYNKSSFLLIKNKESIIILCILYIIPYIDLGKHPYLFSNSLLILYSYISKLIFVS